MNKSPYYLQVGKEVEVFEQSYKNKIPFLLKGSYVVDKSVYSVVYFSTRIRTSTALTSFLVPISGFISISTISGATSTKADTR